MDVTPTVLALMGVPVPDGLDGQPLDLLKGVEAERGAALTEPVEARPERALAGAGLDPATGYTTEEEDAVRRRLEHLGYL